jgi:glucose-6-phosphate isomerase
MTTPVQSAPSRAAWKALEDHHRKMGELHLRKLFAEDPQRGDRFAIEAAGIYLDYSKNRITGETVKLLFQLAEECGLRARIDAMFRGEKINITENRAVLHVALRAPKGANIIIDGENVVHEWLTTAATVPGFVGFAVGRTVFWEPLVAMRDKKISRDAVVAEFAGRYQALVDAFEQARA